MTTIQDIIADAWTALALGHVELASQIMAAMTTDENRKNSLKRFGETETLVQSGSFLGSANLLRLVKDLVSVSEAEAISVETRWNAVVGRLGQSHLVFDAAGHNPIEVLSGLNDGDYETELKVMCANLKTLERSLEDQFAADACALQMALQTQMVE